MGQGGGYKLRTEINTLHIHSRPLNATRHFNKTQRHMEHNVPSVGSHGEFKTPIPSFVSWKRGVSSEWVLGPARLRVALEHFPEQSRSRAAGWSPQESVSHTRATIHSRGLAQPWSPVESRHDEITQRMSSFFTIVHAPSLLRKHPCMRSP